MYYQLIRINFQFQVGLNHNNITILSVSNVRTRILGWINLFGPSASSGVLSPMIKRPRRGADHLNIDLNVSHHLCIYSEIKMHIFHSKHNFTI